MSEIEIHIVSNGNFKPDVDIRLNGYFHVHIYGNNFSGIMNIQTKITRDSSYSDLIDLNTGVPYSFVNPGSFMIQLNGYISMNVFNGTNPDFYIVFKEIKQQKI